MRENNATPTLIDVPLPTGTTCSDDWADWGTDFRVISTSDWSLPGTDLRMYGAGIQLADGTVDDGTGPAAEPPKVWIDGLSAGLSSVQARDLAAALLMTADVIDGWAGK